MAGEEQSKLIKVFLGFNILPFFLLVQEKKPNCVLKNQEIKKKNIKSSLQSASIPVSSGNCRTCNCMKSLLAAQSSVSVGNHLPT